MNKKVSQETQQNQLTDKNVVEMSQTNRYQNDRFVISFVRTTSQN